MKVEFLKPFRSFKTGQTANLTNELADKLINEKTCKKYVKGDKKDIASGSDSPPKK